ncbi:hypothetical protein DSO57_1034241 [Entomophthora muscae]|uniref:Uncharacterized protein n=1 Tax=Entomophthora muscae TaxID=34485 RepID=A0ACC2UKP4_9FUNG|nr:hypothetical protein DSO57_1034241 [Entomophthora muscae]
MENEEDLSCIIIEDDTSEDALKAPIRSFGNDPLDQNVLSSPNYTGGIIYGGYDDPNEPCNYLEELPTGYYMANFLNDLNPSSEHFDLARNEGPDEFPKLGTPVLSTPSPKLAFFSPGTATCPGSEVVDLTTPIKNFKKSTVLKRSKNILEEPKSPLKRQKSHPEAERHSSSLEKSAELI